MLNFKQQDYGTDCAWNIVTGCSKCAPACKYCHVLRCKTKYPEVKFHAEKLESPLYAAMLKQALSYNDKLFIAKFIYRQVQEHSRMHLVPKKMPRGK